MSTSARRSPFFGGSINAMAIHNDIHIYYKYTMLAIE